MLVCLFAQDESLSIVESRGYASFESDSSEAKNLLYRLGRY
jgi:hypothetical protein